MAASPASLESLILPPFSAHAPQPTASTSGAHHKPASAQQKPRRRLPKEAKQVLEDWISEEGPRANAGQRRVLLAQIHAVKGCEWYTCGNIENFLVNRRKAMSTKVPPLSKSKKHLQPKSTCETTSTILWPSLSEESLSKLAVLYSGCPDPNLGQIEIWAEVLGAAIKDINIWIRYKRAEKEQKPIIRDEYSDDGNETSRAPHLPTPEPTASPEPQHRALPSPSATSPVSPFFTSSIFCPSAQSARELSTPSRQTAPQRVPSQCDWRLSLPPAPYAASLPTVPPALQSPLDKTSFAFAKQELLQSAAAPPAAAVLLQQLAASVNDLLSAPEPEPDDVALCTPQEFAQRFEPHERRIQEFLDNAQKGAYAGLGLVPSMIPRDSEVKEEPMNKN